MTVLDEFYDSYLHYSVAQRLFEDTCRQLRDCKGTVAERQALVDETLRLAMCVSDNIDETEGLIADTLEFIQTDGGDPDMLDAISLIANNLKEDRARANSYSNFITYRRLGNRDRKPRKPQIANPFVPLEDDDGPIEAIVFPPKGVESEPIPSEDEGEYDESEEPEVAEEQSDEEDPDAEEEVSDEDAADIDAEDDDAGYEDEPTESEDVSEDPEEPEASEEEAHEEDESNEDEGDDDQAEHDPNPLATESARMLERLSSKKKGGA